MIYELLLNWFLLPVVGRRASVVLPNDPDLVDVLAKNGVDISVSEGEQQVLPSTQGHLWHT